MNIRFKNFIFYGLSYGLIFFTLSFLLSYYSFHLSLQQSFLISGITGVICFVMNGFVQGRFSKSSAILENIHFSLPPDEEVSITAPANHMIDDHLISGKLFLTQKRLLFISFDQKEYSWPLENFRSYKFYPSLLNTGGEFIITDANQGQLVFEVDEIKKWKRKLT